MNFDLASIVQPPLLTADLPGIGGRIKASPDDFDVEEIPAYEPCGSGDFLFLWLEKRGLGAEFFTRQIARRLGIAAGDVGTAGLKDRHAVTRQWVSVPAAVEARLCDLEGDGIQVLRVSRHGNKLRPGHLHGNRFRVVIRDIAEQAHATSIAGKVIERIRQNGLPNVYGPQRFGHDGETLHLGLALIHDQPSPLTPLPTEERSEGHRRRPNLRNPFLRKLALSAVQSALFNQYLAARMSDSYFRQVLHGDVMAKWPAGGMFVAEDIAAEQARFDRREIVSAGPIFGRKTFPAKHEAAEREARILSDAGLSRDSFSRFGKLLMGSRRHNVVYVDDLAAQPLNANDSLGIAQLESMQLTFTLPAGSYATVLLREVMKAEVAHDEGLVDG